MAGLDKSSLFKKAISGMSDGSIDWDTDSIRALLMRKTFGVTTFTDTFRDSAEFLNTINFTNDVAKTDLSPVGVAVTHDITYSATDDVYYGAGDNTITFTTVTSGYGLGGILLYCSSGATRTASRVICYCKFTAGKTAGGGDVTVTVNANGFFKASYD